MKILPSITTIGFGSSSWRDKIQEILDLRISEFAVFLTGLKKDERPLFLSALKGLRKDFEFTIPFVHAISEMSSDDYRLLIDNFGTERFNLHPVREFALSHPLSSDIRKKIFIENSGSRSILTQKDLEGFAGVCLDLSHLRDLALLDPERMPFMESLLETSFIGANHISAVLLAPRMDDSVKYHSSHIAYSSDDFNYLESFPLKYFADFCAIEVENSITEQLIFRARIEAILSEKIALSRRAA